MISKYIPCFGVALAPEYEVKRLAAMGRNGWHLKGMALFGVLYHLEKGEPHSYEYSIMLGKSPTRELVSLCAGSGWSLIFDGAAFQIFRAEEKTTPLFTDLQSKVEFLSAARRNYVVIAVAALVIVGLALAMIVAMNSLPKNDFTLGLAVVATLILIASLCGLIPSVMILCGITRSMRKI